MSIRTRSKRSAAGSSMMLVGLTVLGTCLLQANDSRAGASQQAAPPSASPSGRPTAPPTKPPPDQTGGFIAAPPGSETLAAPLAANALQMFEADNFEGTTATVERLTNVAAAGSLNELPHGLGDSLTSLRWNLEPGIIVVFYEDGAGKGEQLTLWGKGQAPTVGRWDFNDKASRWAWYNLDRTGGSASASPVGPHGSKVLSAAVPENTIQLFRDKNFKGSMQQVSPVTTTKAGERQRVEGDQSDSLSSLRWNLPSGAIVMLYQDADGRKQQIAIWGEGEVTDLDVWDFNDKASRWAWAYVIKP